MEEVADIDYIPTVSKELAASYKVLMELNGATTST